MPYFYAPYFYAWNNGLFVPVYFIFPQSLDSFYSKWNDVCIAIKRHDRDESVANK